MPTLLMLRCILSRQMSASKNRLQPAVPDLFYEPEVRNDLQSLRGRPGFSIGYRFSRITDAWRQGRIIQ